MRHDLQAGELATVAKPDVQFVWRGDQSPPVKRLYEMMEKRLDICALALERKIKTSFGNPPREPDLKRGQGFKKNSSRAWKRAHPSKPYSPPNVQTGHLRRSIASDKPMPLIRRVGLGIGKKAMVNYGVWLEFGTRKMLPRPFLIPALKALKAWMAQVLRKKP
jgi:hypothetical protein